MQKPSRQKKEDNLIYVSDGNFIRFDGGIKSKLRGFTQHQYLKGYKGNVKLLDDPHPESVMVTFNWKKRSKNKAKLITGS